MPRTVGAFLIAALAAAVVGSAAGCASGGQSPNNATGSDAFGEAPGGGLDAGVPTDSTTTSAPTTTPPPAPEDVTTEPTAPSPGVTLTLNPELLNPGIFLAWPSPADCIAHDPTTVAIKYTASSNLWQIVDGGHALLAYKREVDAKAGLALAQAYKKHCFIGRGNTRADRKSYILDYWLEPVKPTPGIVNPDCLSHVPANLVIKTFGDAWRLESTTGEYIQLFDTKADADKGLLVFKHYNRHCYIGRGYTGTDRKDYITEWFATA